MRKLLYLIFAVIGLTLTFTACEGCQSASENGTAPDLVYNLVATAEGEVEFTWFNGGATINGEACLHQCNDTINAVQSTEKMMDLSTARESEMESVANTAEMIDEVLTVKGVKGKYHLKIEGYVKYGPVFIKINEEYPKDSVQ